MQIQIVYNIDTTYIVRRFERETVKEFLGDVSYFRLIKAYRIGVKKKNDKYNKGITFQFDVWRE